MTQLIEIARPDDHDALRQAFYANALSLAGLEAAKIEDRPTWLEVLGPVKTFWDLDRPFRIWKDEQGHVHTEGVSTCGLVAEGIWRRMNVDLASLYLDYVWGKAIERSRVYAQKLGAWKTPLAFPGQRPQKGDTMVIGKGYSTHACTVLETAGDVVSSIDGGQTGLDDLQAIYMRTRTWRDHRVARRAFVIGTFTREVQAWIDVTKLHYRGETCLVPKGWEF